MTSTNRTMIAATTLIAAIAFMGVLTAAEAETAAAAQQRAADLFARFDTDGNGSLDVGEIGAYTWGRYDTSTDGIVSKQEFIAGRLEDEAETLTATSNAVAWALLDWTGDNRLSGNELNGVWREADSNGDGIVTKDEFDLYFEARQLLQPKPANPNAGPADVGDGWKTYTLANPPVAFKLPGDAKPETTGVITSYTVATDNNQTTYKVVFGDLSAEDLADPAKSLAALRAQVSAGAKVLDEGTPQLGNLTGMELLIKRADNVLMRHRVFFVGTRMVYLIVIQGPASKAGPADVNRYFDSLTLTGGTPQPGITPVPPPSIITVGPPATPAAGPAGMRMLITVADAGDAAKFIALADDSIRGQIDLPMAEIFFDILAAQMGHVTAKLQDSYPSTTAIEDGRQVTTEKDSVAFEKGPVDMQAMTVGGKFVDFRITSPQIADYAALLYAYLIAADDARQQNIADYYMPQCQKFLKTLFEQGPAAAAALTDPLIRAKFQEQSMLDDMASVRAKYGPVTKMELETFETLGNEKMQITKFSIGLALSRAGKGEVSAKFAFRPVSPFHAVMTEYEFSESLIDADPVKPAAPPAPPAPGNDPAQPRIILTPPAAPAPPAPQP
jgi:hypothetical protein